MKLYKCWKCNGEVMPFLEEDEWHRISPLLSNAAEAIKEYREINKCDLTTARLNCKPEATRIFEELTGMSGVHFETIYHHRLKQWGPECTQCSHLLRTPRAKLCANCGAMREIT